MKLTLVDLVKTTIDLEKAERAFTDAVEQFDTGNAKPASDEWVAMYKAFVATPDGRAKRDVARDAYNAKAKAFAQATDADLDELLRLARAQENG